MRIELYIKSKEGTVKGAGEGILPHLSMYRGKDSEEYAVNLRSKMEFFETSDDERKIIELLDRVASQHNVEMKIYDMARSRYAFRAFFKGIRKTPTIIIGRNKLTGNITEEQIVKVLKETQPAEARFKQNIL